MFRMDRVNSEVMKALLQIIQTMSDRRIANNLITISYVQTAPDLKNAKVGVSGENVKEVVKVLNSSKGYIRRELASKLIMKNTPELLFVVDDTAEKANRIEELLKKISE